MARSYEFCSFTSITSNDVNQYTEKSWEWFLQTFSISLEKNQKGGMWLFSCVKYKPFTTRANINVENSSCIVFDFDSGIEIKTIEERLQSYTYLLFTSFSHTLEKPRFRVILPLRENIPASDWPEVWERARHSLALECDRSRRDIAGIQYGPCHPVGTEPYFSSNEGELLDPALLPPAPASARAAYFDLPEQITMGERDTTLFKFAASLRSKGCSESEIYCAVSQVNDFRCKPPLSNDDIQRISQSAVKYKPGSGITKHLADFEDTPLSQLETLYLTLERHGSLSFLDIRQRLHVSKSHLSHLLKNDREGDDIIRLIQNGKNKVATLRKGSGVIECQPDFTKEFKAKSWLPSNFHDFLSTDLKGFRAETFFGILGYTDQGKSQFLLNAAIHNAERGLSVFFVRHEVDSNQFYADIARRYTGRGVFSDVEEAISFIPQKIQEKLKIFTVGEEAQLDEFLEDITAKKPDLVVYDYLSQELLDVNLKEQRSIIAAIGNTLSNNLVLKGVPLFTAVQLERDRNGAMSINSRWLRRMSEVLWCEKVSVDPNTKVRVATLRVEKNKYGGLHQGSFIRVQTDPSTFRVVKTWDATEEVKNEKRNKEF